VQFELFKTFWGHEGSFKQGMDMATAAGFDGIEAPCPSDPQQIDTIGKLLQISGLGYIAEICTAGSYVPDRQASPEDHLKSLEQKLVMSLPLQPKFFNVMAGCDAWPLDEQIWFFNRALEIADKHNVICSFETHRSRSFFNPWVTRDVLRAVPDLKITMDISHWSVVCERLMDSEWDVIEEIAPKTHHIHGRIGYDQGPQVPHPAAPEYARERQVHEDAWELVWQSQLEQGYEISTLTPEFGPDGYLHTLPFTNAPVADLWEINQWVGNQQRIHFADWQNAL
jgi:hypothetical protein